MYLYKFFLNPKKGPFSSIKLVYVHTVQQIKTDPAGPEPPWDTITQCVTAHV